jgi:ribonuclease D
VNVGGNLARIGREFGAEQFISMRKKETIINLGQYAWKRDVVKSGAVGLKELIKIVLGFYVDKNADDTFSNWNADDLTAEQVKYA